MFQTQIFRSSIPALATMPKAKKEDSLFGSDPGAESEHGSPSPQRRQVKRKKAVAPGTSSKKREKDAETVDALKCAIVPCKATSAEPQL